jgi:hypothetical protein
MIFSDAAISGGYGSIADNTTAIPLVQKSVNPNLERSGFW